MTQLFFAVNIHAQTKGITLAYRMREFVSFFGSLLKPSRSPMDIVQDDC